MMVCISIGISISISIGLGIGIGINISFGIGIGASCISIEGRLPSKVVFRILSNYVLLSKANIFNYLRQAS